MARVVALRDHLYAQVLRPKGEIYEIDDIHLELFRAMGNAEPAPEPAPGPRDSGSAPPARPDGRRRHRRRDMEAEP